MFPRAAIVPIAKRFPITSILSGTKNVAFGREDAIRANREREISQTRLQQIDGATGINCPDRASLLQFANQSHALRIENWFASARNKRSVEIHAEKLNSRVHPEANLGIDFANAIRDGFWVKLRVQTRGCGNEISLRTGDGTARESVALNLTQ